jgi:hypothetical protein
MSWTQDDIFDALSAITIQGSLTYRVYPVTKQGVFTFTYEAARNHARTVTFHQDDVPEHLRDAVLSGGSESRAYPNVVRHAKANVMPSGRVVLL